MSEAITACENVCRDFAWTAGIREAVVVLGAWLGEIAPFAAIIWAIYAYFHKLQNERDAELRLERRKEYRAYFDAMDTAIHSDKSLYMRDYGLNVVKAVMPHHQVLSLIAPDEVARCSIRLINCLIGSAGQHYNASGKPIPTMLNLTSMHRKIPEEAIDEVLQSSEPIRTARSELMLAMRADLLQGTKVDPVLTNVEDLEI